MSTRHYMLWLLLFVSLTFLAQTEAVNPQHEAHEGPDHCCLLCHVGPFSLLHSPAPAPVAPQFESIGLAPAPDYAPAHDVLLAAPSSRAPPLSA